MSIKFANYLPSPANLKRIVRLLSNVSDSTQPATEVKAGVVKKATTVTDANVNNADAGVKINAVIAALKAAGIMS